MISLHYSWRYILQRKICYRCQFGQGNLLAPSQSPEKAQKSLVSQALTPPPAANFLRDWKRTGPGSLQTTGERTLSNCWVLCEGPQLLLQKEKEQGPLEERQNIRGFRFWMCLGLSDSFWFDWRFCSPGYHKSVFSKCRGLGIWGSWGRSSTWTLRRGPGSWPHSLSFFGFLRYIMWVIKG